MSRPRQNPGDLRPSSRERAQQSISKVIWICFTLGAALFVGGICLVYTWFHDPSFRSPTRGGGRTPAVDLPGAGVEHSPRRAAVPLASAEGEAQTIDVLFTADGLTLTPEVTTLPRRLPPHDLLVFALQRLLEGPAAQSLVSPVPSGARLRAAYLMGDTAVVDLEGNLLSRPTGGPTAEMLCVYAVVDTVTANLPSVRSVQILVDGRAVPFLWDQLDLSAPLLPDDSLIRR
jgi:hypothetical protein